LVDLDGVAAYYSFQSSHLVVELKVTIVALARLFAGNMDSDPHERGEYSQSIPGSRKRP
jgi:hypothetical protein